MPGLVPVPWPVTGRSTSAYRHALHTKQKRGFGARCDGRGWERVAIHASAAECSAPHSPSQMSPLPRLPHRAQASRLYCPLSTTPVPSEIKKCIFVDIQSWCKRTSEIVSLRENVKERGHGFLEGSPYMHRLASDLNLLATIRRNADNLS
jgi:hypothetical protein